MVLTAQGMREHAAEESLPVLPGGCLWNVLYPGRLPWGDDPAQAPRAS